VRHRPIELGQWGAGGSCGPGQNDLTEGGGSYGRGLTDSKGSPGRLRSNCSCSCV